MFFLLIYIEIGVILVKIYETFFGVTYTKFSSTFVERADWPILQNFFQRNLH